MEINKKIVFEFNEEYDFDGKKYRIKSYERIVQNIKEEFEYKTALSYKINGKAECRILVACLDENGNELSEVYTESGRNFYTVKNTRKLRIRVVIYSFEEATVKIESGYVVPVKPYEKREVVLAAIAVEYGAPDRTYEMNLKDTLGAIDEAAEAKPDIIVCTETFFGRNVKGATFFDKAREICGEPMKKLCAKAKEYNTYLAFSVHYFNKNRNPQNMGILIGRNGEIVGTYAKTHITAGERIGGIEPGNEVKVFECDFGRVAFAICWDLFFPGFTENFLHQDVDVILNPTAGFEPERTSERAKETGAYIVTSTCYGKKDCRITAPSGEVVAEGNGNAYVSARVDLNKEYYVRWLSVDSYSTRKNVFHYERNTEV